jgi:hypothetical protein
VLGLLLKLADGHQAAERDATFGRVLDREGIQRVG